MSKDNGMKKFTVVMETTGTKQQCKISIYHYNMEYAQYIASQQFPEYNIMDCYEENI